VSRIVHLGLGAFHRAHQAVYTADAGGDWEICGVAWRSRAVVDALRAAGGRYRLIERGPVEDRERQIGIITETLVAQEEPDAVVQRLADPDTRVVTITITEGGYDGPMMELLARGLAARGGEPIAVLSCDNVAANGEVTRRAVGGGATFVSTVADRITPASDDPLTVITEPFSLWIIERFDGDRPAWERAGALIVDDTGPYELMKLRLVNASHSALAHLGIPRGHKTVADAIADPELRDFVERLIAEELRPTLPPVPEIDLDAFVAHMFERFANPRIRHRLQQIATGAEHKIPLRFVAPARELRAAGRDPVLIERVIAAAGFS
jgi:fructuronate reductase